MIASQRQKLGEAREDFTQRLGGSMALPTPWFQISRFQNSESIFLLFEPPRRWCFVSAVLRNECSVCQNPYQRENGNLAEATELAMRLLGPHR